MEKIDSEIFSLRKSLFLSCKRYAELASIRLDKGLKWFELPGFWFHHVICTVCRRFKRQIELIDTAVANLDERLLSDDMMTSASSKIDSLSDEAKQRISDQIRRIQAEQS